MKSEKYIEIGQRLRKLRGSLSQIKMAQELAIHLRSYQNYESGKRIPPMAITIKIAQKFKTSVDWILTGEETTKPEAHEASENNRIFATTASDEIKINREQRVSRNISREAIIALLYNIENVRAQKNEGERLLELKDQMRYLLGTEYQEIETALIAFIEVIFSKEEGIRLALLQNTFMFQQAVHDAIKVRNLEEDIMQIKKMLESRETDFKTQKSKRES